jgi:hypothetical protein
MQILPRRRGTVQANFTYTVYVSETLQYLACSTFCYIYLLESDGFRLSFLAERENQISDMG